MPKHHLETISNNPRNRKPEQRNGNVSLSTNPSPKRPKEDETGLIASINPNLPCTCGIVAHALRDDLPKILGMSNHRAALQISRDELLDCNPEIKFEDPCESNTNDSERTSANPPKGKL